MPGGVGVTGDENALVGDGNIIFLCVGGCAPLEVEDVVLHVVPIFAQILGDVKFLVNFARLVLELCAAGPAARQSPRALGGVEHELMDLFARVERADVAAAVLGDPVDSSGA